MKPLQTRSLLSLVLPLALVFAPYTALFAQTPGLDQSFPADLAPISLADVPPMNVGGLYMMSTWPTLPPLPPPVVFGRSRTGRTALRYLARSEVPTNGAMYFSASLVALFIDDRQAAAERMLGQAASHITSLPQDGGGGSASPWIYGANQFWVEPVSLVANLFNASLHGTTYGSNYLISSAEALNPQTNSIWRVEGSLQGGTNDATPFALGIATRTNSRFIRAQVCDECATTALPLWWQLAYFGVTGVDTNADYDNDGVNNLAEFLGGTDPNKIRFSLSVASQYVNTTAVPVQLNIEGGVPSYIAVLVNDTNASWQPFTSTNLSVPTPADGVYVVTVGLCGLATNAAQTWHSVTLTRDATPLTLALTNLAARTGSRPFIDPAGYTTRALKALTWTVVDANACTTSGSGAVVALSGNFADGYHLTNWFQCVDLALALGTNWVSIQAADRAGNVAATNFFYVFDTNGDITPPALTMVWPQNGIQVSGDSLTVQAWTDDRANAWCRVSN